MKQLAPLLLFAAMGLNSMICRGAELPDETAGFEAPSENLEVAEEGAAACPGPYMKYIQYRNPKDPQGLWWLSNPNVAGSAVDTLHPGATTIVYYGVPFSNQGCGPTVPASAYPYRIAIFFKQNIPSSPYTLKMRGFR